MPARLQISFDSTEDAPNVWIDISRAEVFNFLLRGHPRELQTWRSGYVITYDGGSQFRSVLPKIKNEPLEVNPSDPYIEPKS